MNRAERALRQVVSDLSGLRVDFALVGGLAVSARAEPRFTRDVDIAVAVADDPAAEAVVRSMLGTGYQLVASIEQDAVGRLASVRLVAHSEEGGAVVDLLFASSGVEPELVAAGEPLEILPGPIVPVARAGHLLALKLLARDDDTRPQDAGDIRALRAASDGRDLALAREAVDLISRRGFHRDRDLRAALLALG